MQDHYTPNINPLPDASGIYRITCTVTGKFYIGSAVNLRTRWNDHRSQLQRKIHRNKHLQNAWDKHGPNMFVFEIIELVLSPFLLEREQHYLDTLKPFGKKGFNIAKVAGSALGMKDSPETCAKKSAARRRQIDPFLGKTHTPGTKEKMRMAQLGHEVSPETRAKISASKIGKPGQNLGKKHSPEAIEKQRLAKLGKKHSEEHIRKVAMANTGRKHSAQSIENMRLAQIGHPVSEQSRIKSRASHASQMRTIIATAPDGTEYIVQGVRAFCIEHHLNQSNLMKVAKGEYSQHKGWTARFPDIDNTQ
jgi:group I intron endonuclease